MNPDRNPNRSRAPWRWLLAALTGMALAPLSSAQVTVEFDGLPLSGTAPLNVQFQDLSTGTPTAWNWEFGDGGVSTVQNPTHTYSSPGSYTVTLTSSDGTGPATETKPSYVVVLPEPPEADFSANRTLGRAPLAVHFTPAGTGSITGGSWDFGDGNTSSEVQPTHTYETPGTYDVTLTLTGPGGSDVETKVGLIQVRPSFNGESAAPTTTVRPPEEADFYGFPRKGPAPLRVDFTNLSRGDWRRRSWNFGDGNNATLAHPAHVYSTPGIYTVALLVRKDFGASSSVEVKPGYIEVTAPLALLSSGGFEAEGGTPAAPWGLGPDSHHRVVSALENGADHGMPSEGERWLQLSSLGTSGATPPEVPGDAGSPPTGTADVTYEIQYDPLHPKIAFDAAFLHGGARSEPAEDPGASDFMSVEVGDGTKSVNIYYQDATGDFPRVSALHGLPMTEVETVLVDLSHLFPEARPGDVLRLHARIGNGGSDDTPSLGYLDALRMMPTAAAVPRRGSGINPDCFAASPPRLGRTWTAKVRAGALQPTRFVGLIGSDRRTLTQLAGGEIFTAFGSDLRFLRIVPSDGFTSEFVTVLPSDPALAGHVIYTQAVLMGDHGASPCNGLDLVLGY